MEKKLTNFAITYNTQIPESQALGERIAAFLDKQGGNTHSTCRVQDEPLQACINRREVDALIVLGGDGTMLRACHLCAAARIPIVGINLGTMGFLIELQEGDWMDYLPRLIAGDYRIEERMMLKAEHMRGEENLGSWQVVNEVVVCRGSNVRPVSLTTAVDGYPMASYVADGIIAATPTGSTAYALAAGGAILPPDVRNIIMVPIAPHLSPDQSIVLPEGAQVSISMHKGYGAVFSVDGHEPVLVEDGDQVNVSASENNTLFVRFHGPGFFYRSLNRYLEWNPTFSRK